MPRIIKIKRAVSSIPAAGVVVAHRVADVVSCKLVTLWNLAAHLHLRRWGDVPAKPANERVVKYMAQQTIEVAGAATLEKRRVWSYLASATIVTRVGDAEAVGRSLALRPGEG